MRRPRHDVLVARPCARLPLDPSVCEPGHASVADWVQLCFAGLLIGDLNSVTVAQRALRAFLEREGA